VSAAGFFLLIRSRLDSGSFAPQSRNLWKYLNTRRLIGNARLSCCSVLLAWGVIVIASRILVVAIPFGCSAASDGLKSSTVFLLVPSSSRRLAPRLSSQLCPPANRPFLTVKKIIAPVCVIPRHFWSDWNSTGLLRHRTRAFSAIFAHSHHRPCHFLLVAGLARWLIRVYAVGSITFTAFALFIGRGHAFTAFSGRWPAFPDRPQNANHAHGLLAGRWHAPPLTTSRLGVPSFACL